MTYRAKGFSLIELIVVMAILGILGAIGYMAFPNPGARAYANDVQALVQQAKFEAVKRNRPVAVAWQAAENRFVALLGETGNPCGGSEIIVGRPASEYRQVAVTFESAPPILLWLANGQARACNLTPFPGTIAIISDNASSYEVSVTVTGRVEVE